MIKKSMFILLLIVISCNKIDVFDTENQVIINPIAKCENGFAGEYPCNNYDLLTYISLEEIAGPDTLVNNCWGWVNEKTKNEYAILSTNKGITFIDITNPAKAFIVGSLKTSTENNIPLEVKVFNSLAYIIGESKGHGLQIFNLSSLTETDKTPVEFLSETNLISIGEAKNIVINTESGFAYVIGSDRLNEALIFLDLNTFLKISDAGNYAETPFTNDAEIVTYNGVDTDYIGKEIFVGSNNNELVLLDVTDKENPMKISSISYTNIGKTTGGSFTKDFNYFIVGDVKDEQNSAINTRSIIFDFTDLDNPVHYFDFEGSTKAIDFDGFIKNNSYYIANATAGVRVLDISNVENKNIKEVGFFDTYPENDNTELNGTRSVYPFLPSGNIIISDRKRGFFVIRKSNS